MPLLQRHGDLIMGFGLPAQQAVEPGLVLVEAFEHPDVVGPLGD
jgi:hypothetical protein